MIEKGQIQVGIRLEAEVG